MRHPLAARTPDRMRAVIFILSELTGQIQKRGSRLHGEDMKDTEQYVKVIEWLARLDTKIDTLMKMQAKLDETTRTADKALQKAQNNEKQIDGIRTTAKWAIGLTIPAILTLAVAVLSIIFK